MIREYHALMTSEIVACDGTIEKYIGDEIFAVFGVPTQGDHDAENALRCAERIGSGRDVVKLLGRLKDRGERALRGRAELVRIWTRSSS